MQCADVNHVLLICVVAAGKYAKSRACAALCDAISTNVNVTHIMHPSPANPAANKAWSEIALAQLTQAALLQYLR